MAGGAAGLAVGRVVYQDPDPATMARLVAEAVRDGARRAEGNRPGVILTVDLGTSVTKVVVWGDDGQVVIGRSPLQCTYSSGNRAEQDPSSWWPSVVSACGSARSSLGASAAKVFGAIEALGFAAARQTFVPGHGRCDTPGSGAAVVGPARPCRGGGAGRIVSGTTAPGRFGRRHRALARPQAPWPPR